MSKLPTWRWAQAGDPYVRTVEGGYHKTKTECDGILLDLGTETVFIPKTLVERWGRAQATTEDSRPAY